jgi:hypothetical protein
VLSAHSRLAAGVSVALLTAGCSFFDMNRSEIAPPREPVTERQGVAIGLEATSRVDAHDYRIVDSGDSAVLLHEDAHGSTIRRFEIIRAGQRDAVVWPTHAVYAKVRDALVEDVSASASEHASDCFTFRMAGAALRRFTCEGAPPHVVTYFQANDLDGDFTRGSILIEHGRGTFGGNTAVWIDLDDATTVEQAFVLRDLHFEGPPDAGFLKAAPGVFRGSVRIEGCTLNGNPVTAAMVDLPADAPLTIS